MNKKQIVAAVPTTLGALDRAHAMRAAIEHRDAVYRAAQSGSPGNALTRLRANERVRAAVRGEPL
ncbi:hypothetical protein [Caballeronia sp. LZ019]|uniref:hypothetical protein n=1 Tax=Caballeronia sp. LZ019 TaxID=3038555 RepID=UPI00286026F4|nr:hypothetical protein [Caballeronia sp. LZ019]MDR5809527.1 hypothetical protein [Caballeronia sp. LZ019]